MLSSAWTSRVGHISIISILVNQWIAIFARFDWLPARNSEYPWLFTVLRTERKMARPFAKVSEEEIKTAFFYPSDLVNTKTTIPFRVGDERWIYTSTLHVSVYIHHYSPPVRGIVVYYNLYKIMYMYGTSYGPNMTASAFLLSLMHLSPRSFPQASDVVVSLFSSVRSMMAGTNGL